MSFIRRYGFDALIALGIVGAIVEFSLSPNDPEYTPTAPLWALAVASVVVIAPLLLRRRFPFGAPVATLVLLAGLSFYEPNLAPASLAVFLAVIASAFLLGMSGERRQAAAGVPIYVAAVTAVIVNHPVQAVDDLVFVTLILTCAWLAGFALRRKLAETEARTERLEEESRRAIEQERARITRELHDVLAHSVSVMTVQASAVRRLLKPEQEREREALLTVEETGRQALVEMRRLLGIMRTDAEPAPLLAPQPGIETLPALVDQVRQSGLPVELSVEGTPVKLPAGVDLSAYRIVQEALTNTLKHAGPARAWVAVRWAADDVRIDVENDGRDRGNGEGSGHGLVGMRERVALCGGELTAGPRPGGGFRITARLPVSGSVS